MWTPATRRQHSRKNLRYETDLTDEEWAIIAPYLPGSPVRGRPHKWSMREIVTRSSMSCAAASPGVFCRASFRHEARFSTGSRSFATQPCRKSHAAKAAERLFSDRSNRLRRLPSYYHASAKASASVPNISRTASCSREI